MAVPGDEDSVNLKGYVRDIPDFPTPGILFRDITPLLLEPRALDAAVTRLTQYARELEIDFVVAAEARGFILGGALARSLHAGFVPARKPGKLPHDTVTAEYTLEYGVNALEMHADAFAGGARVLIHDDLLATGGTARALAELVSRLGGEVKACVFLAELEALEGRRQLEGYQVHSLIKYA
ncbi:MAG TPA: adenine phosphoribosyltransferase [Solirubrobacteraceae bacterium]|jgi:adenine phosphoribosyltransferase|nr:adenine phosphoribosyltransferase [Solirubrobacteraceae bacterium]